MRKTLVSVATAVALCAAGCAGAPARGDSGRPAGPAVTVVRDRANWTADYELAADAPVWAFFRSALVTGKREPWRPAQWTVVTQGVVLERHGHLDVLRAADGGPVPRRVRIALRPAAANLEADYNPALMFTDGSVALFSGHFGLFPLSSTAAAEALPMDLGEANLNAPNTRITWRDRSGPVLFEGTRRRAATSDNGDLYVLFGEAALVDSSRLATVMDPQLPGWVGAEIGDFAPEVADYYVRRLGPGQTDKPTIMVSWNGPTPALRSMGGSVLPGLIVMAFEGVGVMERTDALADGARWFIGHESAHFWLGQTVRYEVSRDAWITEGGADLMAIRALTALDPAYNAKGELQRAVDDCVRLADEAVSGANTRGEHRAYYACGAVFALGAEALQRRADGGDWFDFLKPLIDANREDGVLTRQEWLAALDARSPDSALRASIEGLLDQGATDPAAVVAEILQRAGVPFRRDGDRVVLT